MPYVKVEQEGEEWIIRRHSSHREEFFWSMTLCHCTSDRTADVLKFATEQQGIGYLEEHWSPFSREFPFIRCVNLTEGDVCYISDVALQEGYENYWRRIHLEHARQSINNAYEQAEGRFTWVGIYSRSTAKEMNEQLWRCACGRVGIHTIIGKPSHGTRHELFCFCAHCLREYKRLEKERAQATAVRRLVNQFTKELNHVGNQN